MLLIRMPHTAEFNRHSRYLNIGSGSATFVHRKLGKEGMAGYEPASMAAVLASFEVSNRGCFLDVGAHFGLYSLVVATIFSASAPSVFAFEPTPKTAGKARAIAKENGLAVSLEEMAVCDKEGSVELYISSRTETSNSLDPDFRNSKEHITVKSTSIDRFCNLKQLRPDVIKVDTELLEHVVLAASLETVARCRPFIVCEILTGGNWKLLGPFFEELERLGYSAYHLTSDRGVVQAEFGGGGVLTSESEGLRDWLLAPSPLGPSWMNAYSAWKAAIDRCTNGQNARTPSAAYARILTSLTCADKRIGSLGLRLQLLWHSVFYRPLPTLSGKGPGWRRI